MFIGLKTWKGEEVLVNLANVLYIRKNKAGYTDITFCDSIIIEVKSSIPRIRGMIKKHK